MHAPTAALAYIGPGAGLGALATFAAIVFGFLLLFVGFIWYPLKRMLRKRRTKGKGTQEDSPENVVK
jgi:hypothetical protein